MARTLMLGNEAVARAAYEAGVAVATAYPGTPSTEITESAAKYGEIYCEWAPNEKVALEVAIGASIAGARAMCAMKHVGLNVAADPLFTASYTGVCAGLVLVVADDPGQHSSQNEQDSRYYGLSAKVPVLEPSDSQECLDFAKKAFELSEAYDTPVIVRLTTRVAHSRSLVEVSGRRPFPLKPYAKNMAKYVMMPAMAKQRHVEVEKRMRRLEEYAETTELNGVAGYGAGVGAAGSGAGGGVANGVAGSSAGGGVANGVAGSGAGGAVGGDAGSVAAGGVGGAAGSGAVGAGGGDAVCGGGVGSAVSAAADGAAGFGGSAASRGVGGAGGAVGAVGGDTVCGGADGAAGNGAVGNDAVWSAANGAAGNAASGPAAGAAARPVGVITSGMSWQYVREAAASSGVGVEILKLGLVHPLPAGRIRSFAAGREKVLVAEELAPFIEDFAKKSGAPAVGKELFPAVGELSARLVAEALARETQPPLAQPARAAERPLVNGQPSVAGQALQAAEQAQAPAGQAAGLPAQQPAEQAQLPAQPQHVFQRPPSEQPQQSGPLQQAEQLRQAGQAQQAELARQAEPALADQPQQIEPQPDQVRQAEQAQQSGPQPALPALPSRPPVLCPGCPHRSVFYVLRKLKLNVCGDIGCYTLGALPPLDAMDTCVCMGASIGMAHGMDKARGPEFAARTVAVIGDSTFLHSGIAGLMDVVYNRGGSTVLILDNSITGMTGHQHNPGTGYTIRNEATSRVDLEKLCEALGVRRVRTADPFDVKGLEAAVREETALAEPSVIIARRPCALLKTYRPQEAVFIDAGKCARCKRCMAISCAAISDKGGRMEINEALCARCGLCVKMCGFGAIRPRSEAGAEAGAGAKAETGARAEAKAGTEAGAGARAKAETGAGAGAESGARDRAGEGKREVRDEGNGAGKSEGGRSRE